jgi:P-type Cu2+ transporter
VPVIMLLSMHIHPTLGIHNPTQNENQTLGNEADTSMNWRNFSSPVSERLVGGQEGFWQSSVSVQGLHCAACAGNVERALLAVPGVQQAKVNALTNRAMVVWNERITQPARWIAAVSNAGYGMLPIEGADALSQSQRESRTMLWRWLVAGFCMMQVMMYAWPNYSALPGEMDLLSDRLLRWASWLLTLPVLLFSSQPFFAGAWRSVKLKRITMDVPVAIGIALSFTVSTAAVMEPQGPWGQELYLDSLTMLVFFLLTGRWIESRLKMQVASDLGAVVSQLPMVVQRVDAQDQTHAVGVHQVAVGDVLLVRMGESFAVDGELVHGATAVDEALLTGESHAIPKGVGDAVVAGSVNLQAAIRMRVTQVGRDTRFAQIARLMERSEDDKPAVVQMADRIAGPFLWVVLALAMGAAVFWWPEDPHRAILSAIAVLIVTCPCALALAAPSAFLSSASALARNGLITRRMSAIEQMAKVSSMLFDKTGTLTLGRLQVKEVRFAPSASPQDVWQRVAALCADSLHPVAQALQAYARQQIEGDGKWRVELQVEEVAGEGLKGRDVQGGAWRLGRASFCGVPEQSVGKWDHLCDQHGWLASFCLEEALRPDAKQTLAALRRLMAECRGQIALVSGDQTSQVKLMGQQLGFAPADTHAGYRAQDKLAKLRGLRAAGHVVAMVGDGINDAPVLAAADVSIAPAKGSTLALVKSDFILTAESLLPLAQLQTHSLRTMRIVRQNLWWALAYNMMSVPLAWMGWLQPWMAGLGMAVSSLLVLLNALRLRTIKNNKL